MSDNAVTVGIRRPGATEEYRFDFGDRTVERTAPVAGFPDMSSFLKVRFDTGTKAPRLIGPQYDDYAGLADSWESRPDAAAVLLMDMGLDVGEWTYERGIGPPTARV